jgi:signal transduction histidine kinase
MKVEPELRWPATASTVFALLALAVATAVAFQRHQFTSPSLATIALVITVLPGLALAVGPGRRLGGPRRYSLLATGSAAVIAATYWLVIGFPEHQSDVAPFLLVVLITFTAADGGPWFGAAVAFVCLTVAVGFDLGGRYPFGSWAVWCFAYAISWLGGSAYRLQERMSAQLAQAQAELARRAAEEERHRLARDVHDLIAHSLAVSMLHLTGARMALKAGDSAEALEALEEAEGAGRAAMTEIHHTVGLLGSSEANGSFSPTPCASDLPELIRGFQGAGLKLRAEVSGDLANLSMAEGLAAYRIVQESLANAVKHAPGSQVSLGVSISPTEVAIRVENLSGLHPSRSPGTGQGLRGMTERAQLLGGRVSTVEREGVWMVEAVIPLNGRQA